MRPKPLVKYQIPSRLLQTRRIWASGICGVVEARGLPVLSNTVYLAVIKVHVDQAVCSDSQLLSDTKDSPRCFGSKPVLVQLVTVV